MPKNPKRTAWHCCSHAARAEPVYVCGGEAALADRRVPEAHGLPRATVRDQPHLRGSQGSRAPLSVCLCACPAGGYWLHRWCELPRRCSVQLLQPVEQWLLGVFRHLSLPLHLSRPVHQSLSGQSGRLSDSPGVCLVWHAVSCTIELQCAPALCRLVDWSQYGWCWTSLGGTDWSPRLFPCTRTSLPPRLTCVFASTR